MSKEQVAGSSRVASCCGKVVRSHQLHSAGENAIVSVDSNLRYEAGDRQWPVEIYRLDTAGERASWKEEKATKRSGRVPPLTTNLCAPFFFLSVFFFSFILVGGNAASGS